ncbi:MAG TPA: DUF4214 domain-containing protein [Abditibacterium sp.]
MIIKFFPARVLWLALFVALGQCVFTAPAVAAGDAKAAQNAVTSDVFRGRMAQMYHQKFLERAATPGEVSAFSTQWKTGASGWKTAVATLLGSAAYFQKSGGANDKFVRQLFQDVAGRAPDAGEELPAALDFLKGGSSRAQLAEVVVDSDEAKALTGQMLYQELLHRAPSETEATSAMGRLETGGVNGLIVAIVTSPAYFAQSGGTQSGWQNALNQNLLMGAPVTGETSSTGGGMSEMTVPTPGYPPTASAMNSARAPMVQALLSSPEYASTLVNGYYQKFLRRAATPAEVSQWSGAMQGGASSNQVMMGILTTDEYFNRAGGTTTGFLNRLSQDLLGKSGTSLSKKNLPSTGDLLDMLRNNPFKKR